MIMGKKAFITGISGQDGYFLSQLLQDKGYVVHGLVRRNNQESLGSLGSLSDERRRAIVIHWGDVSDHVLLDTVIATEQFDEVYHLAAQSAVGLSFHNVNSTYDTNIGGTLHVVDSIRRYSPATRLYFAGSSEMFGKAQEFPQKEQTPFYPRSPYGVSKVAGFWIVKNYRESHGLFGANGILFNHESEMRGPEFVTRKISMGVAEISVGAREVIQLGNLDAERDWGYAKEYVDAMWRMLQMETPGDFIIATGRTNTVRRFVELAFQEIGMIIRWSGNGASEIGVDDRTGKVRVSVNPEYYRPAEVDRLVGDPSKARECLAWAPQTEFGALVHRMVSADVGRLGH